MKMIPPLPESVIEVERLFKDKESEVKDFINVIKKDPISSSVLLKAANSPMYGLSNIGNVGQAVTMFGKSTTRGFILQNAMRSSFEIDLEAYGMTSSEFSEVSQKRVFLMVRWYSKISFERLNVLSTIALIANIGQVLIAKAIKEQNKIEEFQALLEKASITQAEKKLVGFTTEEVSVLIAEHWKLDQILIDAIKYGANLKESPKDILPYAMAFYVIKHTINLKGKIADEKILKSIELFLQKYKLNDAQFMSVLERIQD
jgi:HD-like signal output (HDOD) protein